MSFTRSVEHWRSYPRLTIAEAAVIAGVSKRKLEQKLDQLEIQYDGRTRFVLTASLRRYLGEGVEEPVQAAVTDLRVRRKVARAMAGMR